MEAAFSAASGRCAVDRETVSYMAQQVLEVGAVYAETFSEKEDDPMEGYSASAACAGWSGFF